MQESNALRITAISTAVDLKKIDPIKESAQTDVTKEVADIALVSDFTTVANRENDLLDRQLQLITPLAEQADEATVSGQIQNLPLEDK